VRYARGIFFSENFLRIVSALSPPEIAEAQKFYSQVAKCATDSDKCESCDCSTEKELEYDIKSVICYGCRRVVQESNSKLLPSYVDDNAKKIVTSSKLRDQIKDFLLEDE
jgi:hypothetical protein